VSASTECQLLIDPPHAGAWNMAVDEVLLEWAAAQQGCCWWFYGWNEPTVSLGYFQQYAQRLEHAPSRDCPTVRRLTGGGAIVHDADLTYSLAVPAGHRLAARGNLLYETVHLSLLETLSEWGIRAGLCDRAATAQKSTQPLLCFQRYAPGDVLVGGTKIAGSAQRRRRGAVLQQGSVLLHRCDAAPELAALEDVTGKVISAAELGHAWLARLAECLAIAWVTAPLSEAQRARAGALLKTRYGSARWTKYRGRRAGN